MQYLIQVATRVEINTPLGHLLPYLVAIMRQGTTKVGQLRSMTSAGRHQTINQSAQADGEDQYLTVGRGNMPGVNARSKTQGICIKQLPCQQSRICVRLRFNEFSENGKKSFSLFISHSCSPSLSLSLSLPLSLSLSLSLVYFTSVCNSDLRTEKVDKINYLLTLFVMRN